MSCWSDNKLQMEAVSSPFPSACVCVSVCEGGLTFLLLFEGDLCILLSDLQDTKVERKKRKRHQTCLFSGLGVFMSVVYSMKGETTVYRKLILNLD